MKTEIKENYNYKYNIEKIKNIMELSKEQKNIFNLFHNYLKEKIKFSLKRRINFIFKNLKTKEGKICGYTDKVFI